MAIRIQTYDFGMSATDNLRANFVADRLAKNRWGNKFRRLYGRGETASDVSLLGEYDFTDWLRGAGGNTSVTYSAKLNSAVAFKQKLLNNLKVDINNVWSIDGALKHSYMSVLLESVESGLSSGVDKAEVRGVKFSLSIEGAEGKKTSFFYGSGIEDDTACVLEPLDKPNDVFGVYLQNEDADGTVLDWGHYSGGLDPLSKHNTVLDLYGVEDRQNSAFMTTQDDLFAELWAEFIVYVKLMVEGETSDVLHERTAVVVGLKQFLEFVDERIAILTAAKDSVIQNKDKATQDGELIKHLGIEQVLNDEIENPDKLKRIWFQLQKDTKYTIQTDENGVIIPVSEYKWWEEEEYVELGKHVKDFRNYCEMVNVGDASMDYWVIKLKREVFSLPGWKIFWFVSTFLDVDVEGKKQKWWKKVLNFVMLIVGIVLTILSDNPVWLKLLIITTSIASFFGALSPQLQLLMAVVTFAYGALNTSFSSLSGMELFKFAVKNIEQVFKMMDMYEAIGVRKELEEEAREKNKNKSVAQMQDDTMEFIYTSGYSQYDEMYSVLYRFEPKYLMSSSC